MEKSQECAVLEARTPRSSFLIGGVKLMFTGGPISLEVALKGPNVILGLYTCNCSLTGGKELGAAAR